MKKLINTRYSPAQIFDLDDLPLISERRKLGRTIIVNTKEES